MKYFKTLVIYALSVSISVALSATHGIANDIDTNFNAHIETTTYLGKDVRNLVALPDGKTMALGFFNRYNDQPTGLLIRLNNDGSLDTTFNNGLVKAGNIGLIPLPDGKMLLQGTFTIDTGVPFTDALIRINADGTIDPTFNYQFSTGKVLVDAIGRVLIGGNLQIVQDGISVPKHLIRLNDNGTVDTTFNAPLIPEGPRDFVMQNNKVVYSVTTTIPPSTSAVGYLRRFNEDGSLDPTFTQTDLGNYGIAGQLGAQPSGKILILTSNIFRVNVNGGLDSTFQGLVFQPPGSFGNQPFMELSNDGRITIGIGGRSIIRMAVNGGYDPTWVTYNHSGFNFPAFGLHADGSVLIGDSSSNSSSNNFLRLLQNGSIDPAFNLGGTGFQQIKSGTIRAIAVQSDQKVLIGGDFDKVNGIVRSKLARLNADSSLDPSFALNLGSVGNRFTRIDDIYYAAMQSDGKVIVSGKFDYLIGSLTRSNIVRLNADGSIDTTFNLLVTVNDLFGPVSLGRNKPIARADGRILIGTSSIFTGTIVPLNLNSDGSRDTSFSPTIYNTASSLGVFDIAIQPDGKILISGRYAENSSNTRYGYIARLNPDGSIDSGFQAAEQADKDLYAFTLMPGGKIIFVSRTSQQSKLFRLNADGSLDGSFDAGPGAAGTISAIEALPNGKVLVGGLFSTYNGEPRQNFAVIGENGSLDAAAVNINNEVLCIALDADGRILVGGQFTALNVGGQQFQRSYVARLVEPSGTVARTPFDYDGDGRADLSVRRPLDNIWYILRGTAGYFNIEFGVAGDVMVPADYDGDGKTDVAIFRPSNGTWYIFNSGPSGFRTFSWGADGDLPVPADHDGDGKADLVLFRPSTNTWYTRFSATGNFSTVEFGVTGDKPVVGDFDGDGKADIALYRPSESNWYILKTGFGFFVQTWGEAGDIPVPADYDGDGKTDVAVFRPSTGQWFRIRSMAGFDTVNWGTAGDKPIPADYDGDGKSDVAVFRPSNNNWYIVGSTSGQLIQQYGVAGDIPTEGAFIY